VALDVPLAKLFDYAAPEGCELAPAIASPYLSARVRNRRRDRSKCASTLSAERIKRVAALRDDARACRATGSS